MRSEDLENKDFNIQEFVQNANLELIIEGLALMYKKNGMLMMRFPDADAHTLRINIEKNGSSYAGFIVPLGSHIEITHNGATSTMNPDLGAKDTDFKDVLDVKGLHPMLKLKPNVTEFSRSLSIENALIKPKNEKTKFEFWEVTVVLGVPTKVRKTNLEPPNGIEAIMIGGVVVDPMSADPYTKIKVNGALPFETKLVYSDNVIYRMTISNHCEEPDCQFRSDFHHYYKVLDDTSLDGKKYELVSTVTRGHRAPCNIVYSSSDPE